MHYQKTAEYFGFPQFFSRIFVNFFKLKKLKKIKIFYSTFCNELDLGYRKKTR